MQRTIIGEASVLNPKSESRKKSILADLLLTALIDAFSILVIFLLMSFSSTGEILYVGKGVELPKSGESEFLEPHPVIRLSEGAIYLEDKEVKANDLTQALLDLRKRHMELRAGEEFPSVITIQADRRMKYEAISQVIQAAAQAGMSDMKFAVLMK